MMTWIQMTWIQSLSCSDVKDLLPPHITHIYRRRVDKVVKSRGNPGNICTCNNQPPRWTSVLWANWSSRL